MTTHTKRKQFSLQLWHRIIIALVLGVIAGIIFEEKMQFLAPVGILFMNAIKMVIIPVIFASIVCSVLAVGDTSIMGRITIKSLLLYLITMAFFAIVGIILANVIAPGAGITPDIVQAFPHNPNLEEEIAATRTITIQNIITSFIPANPIKAFATGDILGTIVFALFVGFAIVKIGHAAKPVADLMHALTAVMYKIIEVVLRFAPFGVFALVASMIGQIGIEAGGIVLQALAKFVFTVHVGCLIAAFSIYSILLWSVRLKAKPFFKKMLNVVLFAFSTSSSSATLPINMETAERYLGVPENISRFVLPLGATINMNGLALYLGATAVFVANIYQVHLTWAQYGVVVLTSILASMGAAGVPMAALFVMSMVLSSVGLPLEAIMLITAVDRIIDMMTTSMNVAGDALTATLVAKSEKTLDIKRYDMSSAEITKLDKKKS